MRIIAGSAKSLPLKTPKGKNTRPTSDQIKETLFNMIQDELVGANFLDLFAGSGGIGLEALSRGAKKAVFVEQNRQAFACIMANIAFTKMQDKSMAFCKDVFYALKKLENKEVFDLVFMDPPYDLLLEKEVLSYLSASPLIHGETLIIVEASAKTDFSYLEKMGFALLKRKEYKSNVHLFLQKR
jgi:16S rRNA (guanine966-N2)-methyltransferase